MQSPSEDKAQAALLLWAALSPVPYQLLYWYAMPRNGQNPRGNQKSGGRLIFPNFCQSSGAKSSAPRPLIKKP
jgi:hypothetical protein